MKKNIAFFSLLLVLLVIISMAIGGELTKMKIGSGDGLIIGKVFADTKYPYGGLNDEDAYVTGEITGFSVILFKQVPILGKEENSFQMINVATATVKDGEYRFEVPAGKYYVGTIYSDTALHNRRYNTVRHIGGGTLEIKRKGEIVLGPTILLTNFSDGKG